MEELRALVGEARTTPQGMDRLLQAVCQRAVEALGSTRASVWSFSPDGDAITCECLLDSWEGAFSRGTVLREADFPEYFRAIKTDLKVVAPDARRHPATRAFNDVYFAPLDIHSLLDFVVLSRNEPVAILCCEHCGDPREWTAADLETLHTLSTVIGLAWAKRG